MTEGDPSSFVGLKTWSGESAVVINGVGFGRRGERRGSSGDCDREFIGVDVTIFRAGLAALDFDGALKMAEESVVVSECAGERIAKEEGAGVVSLAFEIGE